jgi:hypothetical protein
MQLDEDPLGTTADPDPCLFPEPNPPERGRLVSRQFTIFDVRSEPALLPPHERQSERTLDDYGKDPGHTPAAQVAATAMRRPLIERKRAFVHRIDLSDLSDVRRRRERQVCVAPGIRKDLYLIIDSTIASPTRICQSPISMNKGIPRRPHAIQPGKASMSCQQVFELEEDSPGVLGGIGPVQPMMKMNLNFAPPFFAVVRQAFDQHSVVLFRWIKVSVAERETVGVAPGVENLRIIATPPLDPPLLHIVARPRRTRPRNDSRLKMIGQTYDQMDRPAASLAPRQPLP